MKKVQWENGNHNIHASIGNLKLWCWKTTTKTGRIEWKTNVSLNYNASSYRYGPKRYSLTMAKEDAIRLSKEILADYHTSIVKEMKCFEKFTD